MPSCSPRLFLAALLALLAVTSPAHARHLRQFGSGGTSAVSCLDGFNAWLQSASTCAGSTQTCCAGLYALGDPCWREVMDAAYATADQQTVNSAIQVFESCGFTFPSTSGGSTGSSTGGSTGGSTVPASTPEQQCIDAFNQVVIPTCQAGSQDCCAAHANLGSQCLAYLAAGMAADPQYAQLYTAFTSTLTSCGIPLPAATTPSTPAAPAMPSAPTAPSAPSPPVASPASASVPPAASPPPAGSGGSGISTPPEKCVSDFTWTVLPLCADDAVCCPSLEGLGGECLAVLAASYASDTADPDSAEMAEWIASKAAECGISLPALDPAEEVPRPDSALCLDTYRVTTEPFCLGAAAAVGSSTCCAMLATTSPACKQMVADSYIDPAQKQAYYNALQRCGYSVSTRSAAAAGRTAAAAALVAAAAQAGRLGAAGARRGTPVQPRFAAPNRGLLEQLAGTRHA